MVGGWVGGMLAGGCAVGAELSGTAIFALTAYLARCAMWAAAALTDRRPDQHPGPVLGHTIVPVLGSGAPR